MRKLFQLSADDFLPSQPKPCEAPRVASASLRDMLCNPWPDTAGCSVPPIPRPNMTSPIQQGESPASPPEPEIIPLLLTCGVAPMGPSGNFNWSANMFKFALPMSFIALGSGAQVLEFTWEDAPDDPGLPPFIPPKTNVPPSKVQIVEGPLPGSGFGNPLSDEADAIPDSGSTRYEFASPALVITEAFLVFEVPNLDPNNFVTRIMLNDQFEGMISGFDIAQDKWIGLSNGELSGCASGFLI